MVVDDAQASAITVTKPLLAAQPFAYVTLESYADYDHLACSEWPARAAVFDSLAMADADGAPLALNWTRVEKDAAAGKACGGGVAVSDEGRTVTVKF